MNEGPASSFASHENRAEGESTKSPSILLIDDDAAILQSFKSLLSREGYDVDTAETGKAAMEKAARTDYDLVIIDIKLPDMEGTELLGELRKSHPKTKKVMITGYPSIDNAAASVNLGVHAYLIKPVIPEDFLRVVRLKLNDQWEERDRDQGGSR